MAWPKNEAAGSNGKVVTSNKGDPKLNREMPDKIREKGYVIDAIAMQVAPGNIWLRAARSDDGLVCRMVATRR